jgi:trk system potassium uptake protein TrkA
VVNYYFMHIIVVGCGRVGSGLALDLTNSGHSVAIIDKLPSAFRRRLPEEWPGKKIVGFGFDKDILTQAGAQSADCLAAVTSGDNSNILTARIARETFEIENVVARIYDPKRAEIYQKLGIPTVATVKWTINQVTHRLLPSESQNEIWSDTSNEVAIITFPVPSASAGKKLSDVFKSFKISPVAVERAGKTQLINGESVLQESDLLYLAVYKSDLTDLFSAFWKRS